MKSIFVACLIVFSFSTSHAVRFESNCNFQNCSEEGWVTSQWGSYYKANTFCKDKDCFHKGWISDDNLTHTDSTCFNDDCFATGWNTDIYYHGRFGYETIQCYDSDCLQHGWHIQSSNGMTDAMCLNGDCAHVGWESARQGHSSRTICKLNDCFRYGWTTDAF